MAYTKIQWTEQTPQNSANLDHMETQYDEALADVGNNMSNSSEPLRVEVRSTFPALSAGRLVFNTNFDRFYVSTLSAWVEFALPGQSQAVIE